jgi:hypothetical protein
MRGIQLYYQGHMYNGHINSLKLEYLEIKLLQNIKILAGEYVICYDSKRKYEMRVLHSDGLQIALFPDNSDIFHIKTSSKYSGTNDNRIFPRFNIDLFASISDNNNSHVIKMIDISRSGIGFQSLDSNIKTKFVYDATILCGETFIYPQIYVNYCSINGENIKYGAEIYEIEQADLAIFRAFIVSQHFELEVPH